MGYQKQYHILSREVCRSLHQRPTLMSTLGQQQTFRDVCATVCFAPISGHLPARVTRRLWANKRHSFVWFWDNSWLFFLTVIFFISSWSLSGSFSGRLITVTRLNSTNQPGSL